MFLKKYGFFVYRVLYYLWMWNNIWYFDEMMVLMVYSYVKVEFKICWLLKYEIKYVLF